MRLRLTACTILVLALSGPAGTAAPVRNDNNRILLNVGPIDTSSDEAAVLSAAPLSAGGTPTDQRLHLVQFAGPIRPEWRESLDRAGLKVVSYIPNNAYVVYGSPSLLEGLKHRAVADPVVKWQAPYRDEYKIQPDARPTGDDGLPRTLPTDEFVIQLVADAEANTATLTLIENLGGELLRTPAPILEYLNLTVRVDPAHLSRIAARPDVFSIMLFIRPTLSDEVQGLILAGQVTASGGRNIPLPGTGLYLDWLRARGFPTTPEAYPVVDVVDDGIDNGTQTPLHPDFYQFGNMALADRLIYNTNCTFDANAGGRGGHGNLNAGILGGYNDQTGEPWQDDSGYRRGLGISPYGRLAGTKVFSNSGFYSIQGCGSTDNGVVRSSYLNGAHLTSNSWGAAVAGAYDASSQTYDALTRDADSSTAGNQQMLHVFAAGNRGPGAGTLDSPATGKNVLSVGATENVRASGHVDGCSEPNADNFHDMAGFSSRGPCDDGRVKPDLVAPGTHVQGPASMATGYTGTGVCDKFYPAGQTFYAMSSGTSHSTPAVSGAASLAWNWLSRVHGLSSPSPALLKAVLINSARYLNGSGTGDNLPSSSQGMGHVDLGQAFSHVPVFLKDQDQLFTATGQLYTLSDTLAFTTAPLRVTLAWTDAPGSTIGAAYVNNLDLEVTVGGVTYLGNVFSGGISQLGGAADTRNNVECVFLPAGASGPVQITVRAASLAGDGVPGNSFLTDQDFALVVSNVASSGLLPPPIPHLAAAGAVPAGESCGVPNGVLDPGESVTLLLSLRNDGDPGSITTGVTATLRETGEVQTYGTLTAGENPVARPFTYTAAAPCGGSATAVFDLSNAAGTTSTAGFTFSIGSRLPLPGSVTGSSTSEIAILNNQNALPYPSPIVLSGVPGTVRKVVVTLEGLTHTWPQDIVAELARDNGQRVTLLQGNGDGTDILSGTLTFDDEAAQELPVPLATGTYRPPGSLAALNGLAPNGTWQLYIRDTNEDDDGSLAGWTLTLYTEEAVCCGTNPYVTALTPLPTGPVSAEEVAFDVYFNEAVTGFEDVSDVAVHRTGTLASSGLTIQPLSPEQYRVTVDGLSGSGNLSLTVLPGAALSAAALPNSGAGPSAPVTVTRGVPSATLLPPADPTRAGVTSFSLAFSASNPDGTLITGTRLYVKVPGAASFADSGLAPLAGNSGVFSFSPASGAGIYDFAVRAEGTDGVEEEIPASAEATVIYNPVENGAMSYVIPPKPGPNFFVYPMTDDLDTTLTLSGAAAGSTVTVSRTAPLALPPGYFRRPEMLLDESLTITAEELGSSFTASLEWAFDPVGTVSMGGSPIDTVYRFEGSSQPQAAYPALVNGNVISISGITAFSDWYAGSAAAVPVAVSGFAVE